MLHIFEDLITECNGKLTYKDQPFSGCVYPNSLTESNYIKKVEDGETTKIEKLDYENIYDYDDIEPVGNLYLIDDELANGVAFERSDDFCISQYVFKDGFLKKMLSWSLTGDIDGYKNYEQKEQTISISKIECSRIQTAKYYKKDKLSLSISCNPKGEILNLKILGNPKETGSIENDLLSPIKINLDEFISTTGLSDQFKFQGDTLPGLLGKSIMKKVSFKSIHLSLQNVKSSDIELLNEINATIKTLKTEARLSEELIDLAKSKDIKIEAG